MSTDNVNTEAAEPQTPAAEPQSAPAGDPSGGTQPASEPANSTPPQDNKAGSDTIMIPKPRLDEALVRMHRAEARLRELEAGRQQPANTQQQGAPTAPPKAEDFNGDYEAYQAAVIDYRVQQGIQGYAQQQRQAAEAQAQQERATKASLNWAQKYAEAAASDPTSIAVINAAPIPLRPDLQVNLMEHGNPIALGKRLATDPALTMELNNLPPDLAVRRMWEIGQSLAGSKTQPASASKAPPPISPVGAGKTNTAVGYRDDMSQEEYNRAFPPMW